MKPGRKQIYTLEKCLTLAVEKHDDEYDYSLVEFTNSKIKVRLRHKTCDRWFEQSLYCHAVRGHQCPYCDISKKTDTVGFVEKCYNVKLDIDYSFDDVVYVNSATKIKIGCRHCSRSFEVTPNNFLRGKGCPWCGGKFVDTETFVARSKELFGDGTYGYDNTVYVHQKDHVLITCRVCEEDFKVRPFLHYRGYGCPRCRLNVNDSLVSQKEIDWLDELKIPLANRQTPIMASKYKFKPDALVDRTIYEFYGSYYHGDPRYTKRNAFIKQVGRTAGEQYDWTMWREKCLREAGYDVKFVWELDFDRGFTFSDKHPSYET